MAAQESTSISTDNASGPLFLFLLGRAIEEMEMHIGLGNRDGGDGYYKEKPSKSDSDVAATPFLTETFLRFVSSPNFLQSIPQRLWKPSNVVALLARTLTLPGVRNKIALGVVNTLGNKYFDSLRRLVSEMYTQ
jgi:hypothetical protein